MANETPACIMYSGRDRVVIECKTLTLTLVTWLCQRCLVNTKKPTMWGHISTGLSLSLGVLMLGGMIGGSPPPSDSGDLRILHHNFIVHQAIEEF